MNVSAEGRELIKQFEGLSLTAYRCPAGVWTIGVGHVLGVQPGDKITPAQADAYLASDLALFGKEVESAIGDAPTSQHEFDAMVSLAFNIGIAGFQRSTVLRLHKAGDKIGAARAFGLWNKAMVDGRLQELPGLTRRRAAEAAHYLTADAPAVKDMPQSVAPEKSAGSSKTVIAGGVSIAAGAASVADQIDQITPILQSVTTAGTSLQGLLKLGGAALSVIALCAVAYMLVRYIQKRRRGEVVST